MMFKLDGTKRMLGLGVLGLAVATIMLSAPPAQAQDHLDRAVKPHAAIGAAPSAKPAAPTTVAPGPAAAPAPAATVVGPPLIGSVRFGFGDQDSGWFGGGTWRGYERG